MNTPIENESDIVNAITELENRKLLLKQDLSESFEQKLESLKPSSLLRSAAGSFARQPALQKGLIIAVGGIFVVLAVKKLMSPNKPRKSFAYLALSGITTMLLRKAATNAFRRATSK